MKVLAGLALSGLVAAVCTAFVAHSDGAESFAFIPKCPSNNSEEVDLIGNPDNCTTYYACNYGHAIAMVCSPGLHFNDELKVCDLPENACCDPAYDPQNKCKKLS